MIEIFHTQWRGFLFYFFKNIYISCFGLERGLSVGLGGFVSWNTGFTHRDEIYYLHLVLNLIMYCFFQLSWQCLFTQIPVLFQFLFTWFFIFYHSLSCSYSSYLFIYFIFCPSPHLCAVLVYIYRLPLWVETVKHFEKRCLSSKIRSVMTCKASNTIVCAY